MLRGLSAARSSNCPESISVNTEFSATLVLPALDATSPTIEMTLIMAMMMPNTMIPVMVARTFFRKSFILRLCYFVVNTFCKVSVNNLNNVIFLIFLGLRYHK